MFTRTSFCGNYGRPIIDTGRYCASQMCMQIGSRVVQKRTMLSIAHERTLREWLYADQLVDLRSRAVQTRQIVLSSGEDMLQDRHTRTVPERSDSVV